MTDHHQGHPLGKHSSGNILLALLYCQTVNNKDAEVEPKQPRVTALPWEELS